jgi:hypothetical protein
MSLVSDHHHRALITTRLLKVNNESETTTKKKTTTPTAADSTLVVRRSRVRRGCRTAKSAAHRLVSPFTHIFSPSRERERKVKHLEEEA